MNISRLKKYFPVSIFLKWLIIWIAVIAVFIILVWYTYTYLPVNETWYYGIQRIIGTDWHLYFYPAIQEMFAGRSPYNISGIFNPPWTFVILSPIATFPEPYARSIMFVLTLFVFGIILYHFRPPPAGYLLAMLSPYIIRGAINTNIDWMIPLGMILPPWLGLFFVLAKPQIGIGIAIYWIFQYFKKGGASAVVRMIAPITIVTFVSFAIYGFWPLQMLNIVAVGWNLSLWPYSIPVGIYLLVRGLRQEDLTLSATSSPLFAPYMNFHSYAVLLFFTSRSILLSILIFIFGWFYIFITGDIVNIIFSLHPGL